MKWNGWMGSNEIRVGGMVFWEKRFGEGDAGGGGEGGGGGGRGKTVSGVIEIGNFKGLEGMGFLFPFP